MSSQETCPIQGFLAKKTDDSHFPSCCELLVEGTRIDFCAFYEKLVELLMILTAESLTLICRGQNWSLSYGSRHQVSGILFSSGTMRITSRSFSVVEKEWAFRRFFWKLVSKQQFPCWDFALKMCSIFGSANICKSTFSCMKRLQSNVRNRMSNLVRYLVKHSVNGRITISVYD